MNGIGMNSKEVVETIRREFQGQFKDSLALFKKWKGGAPGQRGTAIGLDIGTTSIKMVEVQQDDGRVTVLKAKRVPIDPGDKQEGPVKALRKALGEISLKDARLVSIVTDPQGSFHKLTVPQMPKSELREALFWELKHQIPFEIGEAEFDHEVLRPVVEKGIKKWEVSVAVLPKEAVRHHLSLLQSVDVIPSRLVQGPLALQSLLKKSSSESDALTAVLEMGYSGTGLSVFRGGTLDFSRRLPISGADFTRALMVPFQLDQEMVSVTFEEAEKVKCDYGLCQKESPPLPGQPIPPSHIFPFLRPVAERLASEIERSFIFYQERSGGKMTRLLFFGGGAGLKELAPFLSESLGMEVVVCNPFEGFSLRNSAERVVQTAPQEFALALGAALSVKGEINLLPQAVKEQRRHLVERAFFKGAVTTLVLILSLLYTGMRIDMTALQKKIAVTTLELSALTPLLEEARQKMLLGDVLNREPYWDDLFKELSHLMPEQAYLRRLTLDRGKLVLEGIIITGREDPEGLLSGILSNMETGIFKNSSLVETEKLEEGKGSSFKIQTELD